MSTSRHNDNDDAALVASLARGDREALGELYDRLSPTMLAVAMRMLGDKREAEDLLHDVFLEIWRKADTYRPARASVKTWCLVRLRSRALDRIRRGGRVVDADAHDIIQREPAPPSSDPSRRADDAALHGALGDLPEGQRAVLELAYFEGLTGSEIAARLQIPLGTVKSRSAAAIRKLRKAFEA